MQGCKFRKKPSRKPTKCFHDASYKIPHLHYLHCAPLGRGEYFLVEEKGALHSRRGSGETGILKITNLPAEIVSGFRDGDEDLLLSLLQSTMHRTDAVYAVALDQAGRVLAHTNVLEKGKVYRDPATQEALRLSQPGYRELQVAGQKVIDVSFRSGPFDGRRRKRNFFFSAETNSRRRPVSERCGWDCRWLK